MYMPVRTIGMRQGGRPAWAGALGTLVAAALGLGACATDICKSKDLKREQICNCQPKDNQLLERLQPTDLPYPVRRVVLRCANDIRAVNRVVTKQKLRDCTGADASLDQPTRDSLAAVINRSNLVDDQALADWNAQCMAGSTDTVTVTPAGATPATPAPTTPAPTTPAPTTAAPPAAPAGAAAPARPPK
jgi:hypothetical protein